MVTIAVVAPLIVFRMVRGTPRRFLFERLKAFKLEPKPRLTLLPAE